MLLKVTEVKTVFYERYWVVEAIQGPIHLTTCGYFENYTYLNSTHLIFQVFPLGRACPQTLL